MNEPRGNFGIIGLGVMGRNLALNVSDHGFRVAVWNLEPEVTDDFVAENAARGLIPTKSLQELVGAVAKPRRILIMIKAGKPVDSVLKQLKPMLDPGDIVIDGGNTRFSETRRREADLAAAGLHFVGMGVSGGEEGARHGPSLMPGGTREAWEQLQPVLEAIAARTDSGPCVTHVGPDGAGHFVKTVHNGIEYADMQLIAEAYDLLGRGLMLETQQISEVFARWNEGPLESFLIELTARVLARHDEETGKPLVELVLDKSEQKGTGLWTVEQALTLVIPVPTISAALSGRVLSTKKAERVAAARKIRFASPPQKKPPIADREASIAAVHDALLASKICSYAQGLDLIRAGSQAYQWNIQLAEIARIWKGGCIIRARLLDTIMAAYAQAPDLSNLLMDDAFEAMLFGLQPNWRRSIGVAQALGIPVPATAASLAYFDSYRTARLPQNLTQAQRDAFGAHTYLRIDKPDAAPVHTDWLN